MIEREKIITQVREIVKRNKLEETFLPLLEEFFCRAVDQYNWTEYDLKVAINRFQKVSKIKFINFWKRKSIVFLQKTIGGQMEANHERNTRLIKFDIDDLKGIFKFDKPVMEEFINTAMHEIGHTIQTKREYGYLYKKMDDTFFSGLTSYKLDAENYNVFLQYGYEILDEYAEVINAVRLQKGYLPSEKYSGYEKIQNSGKVMLSSLGLTEMEFSNLQWKGRKVYKSFIAKKLEGLSAEEYADSFEKILNNLWNRNAREENIEDIDDLQNLAIKVFDERFENIDVNAKDGLEKLAQLTIDQETKNLALQYLFDEYKITPKELELMEGMDIHERLVEKGYDDVFLQKLYDVETDLRLKIQEETKKQEKEYNNEELMEKMYQSFQRYPMKEIPLKDRLSVELSKIIGKLKRQSVDKMPKFLPEHSGYNLTHSKFASKISNLKEYDMQTNSYIQCKNNNIRNGKQEKEQEK